MRFPLCHSPICAMLEKQPRGFPRTAVESRGPYLVHPHQRHTSKIPRRCQYRPSDDKSSWCLAFVVSYMEICAMLDICMALRLPSPAPKAALSNGAYFTHLHPRHTPVVTRCSQCRLLSSLRKTSSMTNFPRILCRKVSEER